MERNLLLLALGEKLHLRNRIEHLIGVIFLISAATLIAARLELFVQFDFQGEAGKAEVLFLRAAAHIRPPSLLTRLILRCSTNQLELTVRLSAKQIVFQMVRIFNVK